MTQLITDVIKPESGGTSSTGWMLLGTQVASSDTEIDVIDLSSDYFMYKFIWDNVKPATDDAILTIRTSTNNGGAWDEGLSDYAWALHRGDCATNLANHTVDVDAADSEIEMTTGIGNAGDEAGFLEITLFNPAGTGYTKFIWEGIFINGTGTGRMVSGTGTRLSAADVDGVRFLFSSGNISSGTLKVYGI